MNSAVLTADQLPEGRTRNAWSWLVAMALQFKGLLHTFIGLPMGSPDAPFVRPHGLRTYLALFAAALTLPLLALAAVSLNRMATLERAQLERRIEQVAQDLARLIDRDVDRPTTMLETLATSQPLARGDFDGFRAQAALALQPDNVATYLVDRNLTQVVNTLVPVGTTLPPLTDLTTP